MKKYKYGKYTDIFGRTVWVFHKKSFFGWLEDERFYSFEKAERYKEFLEKQGHYIM